MRDTFSLYVILILFLKVRYFHHQPIRARWGPVNIQFGIMANMEFLPRIIYLALVLSVLCNFFQYFRGNNIASKTNSSPTVRRALQMNSKLTQAHITIPEGARKVFIDLGANDGASTSYFMNPPEGLNSGSVATQGGDEDSALRGLGSSDKKCVAASLNIEIVAAIDTSKCVEGIFRSLKSFSPCA